MEGKTGAPPGKTAPSAEEAEREHRGGETRPLDELL